MATNKLVWSDQDKARAWVAIQANDGNKARASRDTQIPHATITLWTRAWEKDGGPPAGVLKYVQSMGEDFTTRMELARSMTMDRLVEIVPNITNAQQAAVIIGILSDKIDRVRNAKIPPAAPAPVSLEQVQGQVGEWLIVAIRRRRGYHRVNRCRTSPQRIAVVGGDDT